jgi:hypothetical protein
VEEATEAVASVDILEEVGSGRDTADDVADADADADADVVASVSLDGRAEKASEEVLIIPETSQARDGVPYELLLH